MESSVRRPSPPNANSYVQEENLVLARKLVEIFLLFTCITNQFIALRPRSMDGLEEPFSAKKKFFQPTHSGCNRLSVGRILSPKNGLFGLWVHTKSNRGPRQRGSNFWAWSRKSSRLTKLKNLTSKIQGDVEAFKKRYWGGILRVPSKQWIWRKSYLKRS